MASTTEFSSYLREDIGEVFLQISPCMFEYLHSDFSCEQTNSFQFTISLSQLYGGPLIDDFVASFERPPLN